MICHLFELLAILAQHQSIGFTNFQNIGHFSITYKKIVEVCNFENKISLGAKDKYRIVRWVTMALFVSNMKITELFLKNNPVILRLTIKKNT